MNRIQYLCLHLVLIVLPILAFNQSTSIYSDSLATDSAAFQRIIENQKKLDALNDESVLQSTTEAQDFVSLLKNIGTDYFRINQYDSAIVYYQRGAELSKQLGLQDLYSSMVYNLGLAYMNKGDYANALESALLGLETDKKTGNADNIAASLNSVALIYQDCSIYDKALEYRLESINVSEEAGNDIEVANGYFNLGNLYAKMGKHDQEMEYFQLANEKYKSLFQVNNIDINLEQAYSELLYSMASALINQNQLTEADKYLDKALEIYFAIAYNPGIGNVYLQKGNIHALNKDYPKAIQNYFQALGFKQGSQDIKGSALANNLIGSSYFQLQDLQRAETFLQKSNVFAIETEAKEILQENYRLLSQIYKQSGDFERALNYHQLFKAYTDSILNENTAKTIEELNIKYETDKKEQQNTILELIVKKQQSRNKYLLGIIALVLVILIGLYLQFRSKQKTNKIITHKNTLLEEQNLQIAEQKKVIEDKNRDMTDSIVYAQRIQESLLSDTKVLQQSLPESFILLKPKDIVSGDFYWFGKKDDKFIFAAIDCTGHGVPGAFMSMLGDSYLNQIIYNRDITSPDEILEELNKEIQTALKQEETENQDGMDMALCTIDLRTNVVEFAGAKNPLIFVQNGECVKIKGDKKPIGRSGYSVEPFSKHIIEPRDGTCFYMFSDGYVDQFGGPQGRKFMLKRLTNLLMEIHKKPMGIQREIIDQTIEDWKKDQEQIDDILVVGFRL